MSKVETRKRPASAISTSGQTQVGEMKNNNFNSNTPHSMRNPGPQRHNLPNVQTYNSDFTNDFSNTTGNYLGQNSTSFFDDQDTSAQTPVPNGSTDLVRTQANNQVVPVNFGYPLQGTELGSLSQPVDNQWQGQSHGGKSSDDLDHRADLARRDAQTKRKQIPPFVQKLSSFLNDNTENTDLIRWSDSGDSFIVVDEDEFAKTLIPELFKHNNYASFVRQLNMYGFHKKVGLSDNSMRASERKNKHPSEYSNPYFKRGRPNLLWLIHKPKNAPAKGTGKANNRAKQEDAEEDADEFYPRDSPAPTNLEPIEDGHGGWQSGRPLMLGTLDNKLPPDQLDNLRQEMAEIRNNQRKITEMLNQSRRENAQLYGQAKTYHEMHQQHDKSINAILKFLATFYSRNLQGDPSGLDQNHGNIVDIGDEKQTPDSVPFQAPFTRRAPLLLKDKASPAQSAGEPDGLTPSQWPQGTLYRPTEKRSPVHSPAVHEVSGDTPSVRSSTSPPSRPVRNMEGKMPEQDVLSMLNSTSAQNDSNILGPTMDFSEALSHLQTANGQSPLTPSQQQNMLQLMSNEQANAPQTASFNNTTSNNNALASYSPPNLTANLAQVSKNAEQMSQIEQYLREQEQRMANMQATIAPLSPSGSIPGISEPGQNPPSDFDFDSMFKSDDYFNDGADPAAWDFTNAEGEVPDFDFGVGGDTEGVGDGGSGDGGGEGEGRVKEMDSSEGNSPAGLVEAEHVEQGPRKARRRG